MQKMGHALGLGHVSDLANNVVEALDVILNTGTLTHIP
jgi:hypothetical protein